MVTASHNPARLQRHEVHPRAGAAHQRRHRAARHRDRWCSRPGSGAARRGGRSPPARRRARSEHMDMRPALRRAPAHLRRPGGAAAPARSSSTRATAGPGRSSTCWSRICLSTSSSSTTTPDGTFPHGVPNPLLPENRAVTAKPCSRPAPTSASPGTATSTAASSSTSRASSSRATTWSGCWRSGRCKRHPGASIVHDPRLVWNTIELVEAGGRHAGGVQERARLHQGEDARGGRGLRRRDVGPPLLPGVLLLRQRHDPLAAGRRGSSARPAGRCRSWWASGSRAIPVSGEINLTSPTRRARSAADPGAVRGAGALASTRPTV